jgi:5'-nucleotidase
MLAALALLAAACGGSGDDGAKKSTTTTTDATPASPKPQDPIEILVTNDDGVGAPGIAVLTRALRSMESVHVTVVAPAEQRSGTDGKTTEGDLKVTDTKLSSGFPAKAVDGYPADTIRVALDDLGLKPDVVVSGINEGQNVGQFVDVSGTVGAARAAAERGIPALAVSSGLGDEVDYEAAVPFLLRWVEDHRTVLVEGTQPAQVASMNVPSCAAGEVKDLVEVPVAPAGTPDALSAKQDCTNPVPDPANDVVAFNSGNATITEPLKDKVP